MWLDVVLYVAMGMMAVQLVIAIAWVIAIRRGRNPADKGLWEVRRDPLNTVSRPEDAKYRVRWSIADSVGHIVARAYPGTEAGQEEAIRLADDLNALHRHPSDWGEWPRRGIHHPDVRRGPGPDKVERP